MLKKLFIAGNWKSNKTVAEADEWVNTFHSDVSDITIALCVPFTVLEHIKQKSLSLALAAQDVSPFSDGAYTGEVSARQIKELADWVIIGHSERRKYFGETDEMLSQKVHAAHQAELKIIYCVQDEHTVVPPLVDVVAYEPVWAIGTGKTDTPENANTVISTIKEKTKITTCIYGGSITAENVGSFVRMDAIDGVLPGGASLDPEKFMNVIQSAAHAI